MRDFSEYSTLSRYMNKSVNKILELPETKRHICSILLDKLDLGIIKVIIGGLRKIGKTTVLKQIAAEYGDNAFYISFLGIKQDVGMSDSLTEELLKYLSETKPKVILIDEITQLFDYDSFVGELLNRNSLSESSIIMTGSAKYYLEKLANGSGGCRCDYVELSPITFYEYLSILGKYEYFDSIYYINEHNTYDALYNYDYFSKLNDVNVEELFFDYLEFTSSKFYSIELDRYIQGCYNDFLDSETGMNEEFSSGRTDLDVVKMLFYVLQYKLVEKSSSVEKFYKLSYEYRRERNSIRGRMSSLGPNLNQAKTLLRDYILNLKQVDRKELIESARFLYKWNLLYPIVEKTSKESLMDIKEEVAWITSGTEVNLSDVYKNANFTGDIFLYMSLLKDLYNKCGLGNVTFKELVNSDIKGPLIEYYCVSQIRMVNKDKCSIKLSLTGIDNASEIDILDTKSLQLIEVGIGNKNPAQLAFADAKFDYHYPEYKEYKRVYVSRRNKRFNKEFNYLEVPFWYFGLTVDATVLFDTYRKITVKPYE